MAVYFIRGNDLIKIGVSSDPRRRLLEMQTGSPVELELLAVMPGGGELERGLHFRFADGRTQGEWFRPTKELWQLVELVQGLFDYLIDRPTESERAMDGVIILGNEIAGPMNGWRLERNSNGYYRWRFQLKDETGKTLTYATENGIGYRRGSLYLPIEEARDALA